MSHTIKKKKGNKKFFYVWLHYSEICLVKKKLGRETVKKKRFKFTSVVLC